MPLTRRLILQKARHHPTQGAMTDCKHTVSGTISLPSRGTFHPSLTVLSTIGHQEYLALTSGLARFTRDSTGPMLLGNTITQPREFQLRGSHPLRQAFPDPSPIPTVYHCATTRRHDHDHLPQHRTRNTRRLSHAHGLGSSAFAHHYSRNISSYGY